MRRKVTLGKSGFPYLENPGLVLASAVDLGRSLKDQIQERSLCYRLCRRFDRKRLAREAKVLFDHCRRHLHQQRHVLRRLAIGNPFKRLPLAFRQTSAGCGLRVAVEG